MKSLFFLFLSITCFSTSVFSQVFVGNDGTIYDQSQSNQTNQRPTMKARKTKSAGSGFDVSKLSIGGNFGMQFGDYTMINISPQVGYDIIPELTLGAGFGYTYLKEDVKYYDYTNDYDYKNSYLSFDVFARFYPIPYIVLSVQPEISRLWSSVEGRGQKYTENKFVPSVLVGGGLRFQNVTAMIQYDVIQDDYSPYGDTIFYTIGYTFGL